MSSASLATTGVYVPPFASATTAASAAATAGTVATTATGISFASIASKTSSSAAATSTKFSTAGSGVNGFSYIDYFVIPFLDAHTLSRPSWRYAYILVMAFGGTLFLLGVARVACMPLRRRGKGHHLTPQVVRRLLIRRFYLRKRKSHQFWLATPTVGQMLLMALVALVSLLLANVGYDYVDPTECTWGGYCGYYANGPPSSSYHAVVPRYDSTGWTPMVSDLTSSPNTNVQRTLWTMSARYGLIAFALYPLCVVLGLKQWPIHIVSLPRVFNYHFDRSVTIHRFVGLLIWILTSVHVWGWVSEMTGLTGANNQPIILNAFMYWKFCFGWAAYGVLTLIVILSFKPVRKRSYEVFYSLHVILVVLLLGTSAAHHPTLLRWPVIAGALWAAERAVRLTLVFYINGIYKSSADVPRYLDLTRGDIWDAKAEGSAAVYPPTAQTYRPYPNTSPYPPQSPHVIPPGFALIQRLPGKTMRITLRTVRKVYWRPGQNVFFNTPAVRPLESHPYTIANWVSGGSTEIILVVRVQKGFTRALWDHVSERHNVLRAYISWPMGSPARIDYSLFDAFCIVCGGSGISFGVAILEHLVQARRTARVRLVWLVQDHSHISWVAGQLRRCLNTYENIDVSIYVTKVAKRIAPAPAPAPASTGFDPSRYEPDTATELLPPTRPYTKRPTSASDVSDTEMESDSETTPVRDANNEIDNYGSVTAFVLFGDEDTRTTRAERRLSKRVKNEGRKRRTMLFGRRRGQGGEGQANQENGTSGITSQRPFAPIEEKDEPFEAPPAFGSVRDSLYSTDTHAAASSASMTLTTQSDDLGYGQKNASCSYLLANESSVALKESPSQFSLTMDASDGLDLSPQDRENIDILSELVIGESPNLADILDSEINSPSYASVLPSYPPSQSSQKRNKEPTQSILVATCGPIPLNTFVRTHVASRMTRSSPKRIEILSEDFSY